jgi:hypothetical protein
LAHYKRHPINIWKGSQWSYLITKKKLIENELKKKIKKNWNSITNKTNTKEQIEKKNKNLL